MRFSTAFTFGCTLLAAAGLDAAPTAALWSLEPVNNPAPPAVSDKSWTQGAIDHFVLAKLEQAGLKPSPEADRRALIRRLHIDLTGLPPSFDEVRAFERDTSPDAYGKLVERLLASPHFGERWARHWLDVARYSDTKGYVFEEARDYPYAYAFRDWTIRAFNDDLPYDQFLIYQLAADKAATAEADKHHLAAMGFLTVGRRFLNREPDIIDDRIDVAFRGTMALTVACARCHDHKYDPVPTDDYYSIYGVFASSEEPKDMPLLGAAPDSAEFRAFEAAVAEKQQKIDDYLAGRAAELAKPDFVARYMLAAQDGIAMDDQELKKLASSRNLLQQVTLNWRRLLKDTEGKDNPVFGAWHALAKLPPEGFAAAASAAWQAVRGGGAPIHPRLRESLEANPPQSREQVAKLYGELLSSAAGDPALSAALAPATVSAGDIYRLLETTGQQHVRRLRRSLAKVGATHSGAPPRGMVLVDRPQPVEPQIFERGDPGRRGARVPRQFLEMLKGKDRKPFSDGSGRLEMAREIASKDNPLTARVWANRVWGHLLGTHLVETPSDFGARSDPPSHPQLLDHLARKLMDDGWSTKALIRQIVLSATYRQSSFRTPHSELRTDNPDPENRLYSHANRRRLDFEAFRDSMLAVSGQLDLSQFGRPVDIDGDNYSKRRTIYGQVERQNLPPVFRTFDFASPDVHVPKRPETTVPQQALFMMNGRLAQDQAAALMRHPDLSDAMKDEARVRFLYHRVLAREPDAEEITDALAFVKAEPSDNEGGAWDYGYGRFDQAAGSLTFQALPHFTGSQWQGGEKLPDPKLGWVTLHKTGGHPGDAERAAMWRWVAPQDGRYEIRGSVDVPSSKSDGVFAAVFKGEREKLLSARVGGGKVEPVRLDAVPLRRGDALYFVVACGGNESFDSFRWNPGIRQLSSGQTWVASEGFRTTKAQPTASLWEQLAQALLASNEFAFID